MGWWPFRQRETHSKVLLVPPSPTGEAKFQAPAPSKAAMAAHSQPVGEEDGDVQEITAYGQVPRFIRVLTAGDDAEWKLEETVREALVALELSGKRAQIIYASDRPQQRSLIDSLCGVLRAKKFTIQPHLTAPASVIAESYRVSNQAQTGTTARSANSHMALVHKWISYAVHERATDIHIEMRGSQGRVRFRIDGELEPMRGEGEGVYASATAEKAMAALFNNEQQKKSGSDSLFDASSNLYCMVPYAEVPGHTLKLRYQSLKGNEGPKVVLRLLPVNEDSVTKTFQELGYEKSQEKLWTAAMHTPSGAVLTAGVTGSGKSTTNKAFIEHHPHLDQISVLTVEDPVEYPIKGAHQIPVQRDVANPEVSAKIYSEVMASIVRADLDLGMLGEIRDQVSAMAMQQISETGHMALATLHAHLLSGIVPRLVNPQIGLNREILTAPNMLTLLVYQALVPVLCPECSMRTKEAMDSPEVTYFLDALQPLGLPIDRLRWKRKGGCDHCKGRGSSGLTVVAEMLMPDEDWLRPIREGNDVAALEVYRKRSDLDLLSENMAGKTVFEHTLLKAFRGEVDALQCMRFDNVGRYVSRYQRLRG